MTKLHGKPLDENGAIKFEWRCLEGECNAVHLSYKEHIAHLVNVHGLLGNTVRIVEQTGKK